MTHFKGIMFAVIFTIALISGAYASQQLQYILKLLDRYDTLETLESCDNYNAKNMRLEIKKYKKIIDGKIYLYLTISLIGFVLLPVICCNGKFTPESNNRLQDNSAPPRA